MINFKLNYDRMGMRPKDSRAFEWYTASLKLFGLHISDIEGEGIWMWKVYGSSQLESKGRFKTFEDAKASLIRFLTSELKATLEEIHDE